MLACGRNRPSENVELKFTRIRLAPLPVLRVARGDPRRSRTTATAGTRREEAVCTENLNPNILVVKRAKDSA
jgi:hypothetical protein